MSFSRRLVQVGLAAGWLAVISSTVMAQPPAKAWPTKPIEVIVPFPPGPIEAKVRIIADKVGRILGQPLILVHRPGAGMRIGTEAMVRATPDGHTVGVAVQSNTWISLELDSAASYTLEDMTLLAWAYQSPMVLVTGPKSGLLSAQQWLRVARAQPDKFNYAAPTGGSMFRIAFESIRTLAGIETRYVPYRGMAQVAQDLAGGHVDLAFVDLASLQLMRHGHLRPLAVATPRRVSQLPEVPTFHELGISFESLPWLGFAAPAGLPPAVEQRLIEAFAEALRAPEVRRKIEGDGVAQVFADTRPALMRARIEQERADFRRHVRPGSIRFD